MTSSSSSSSTSTSTTMSMNTKESEEDLNNLFVLTLNLLNQVINLLKDLNHYELNFNSKLIQNSSIGKHLRHVNQHFRILLESIPFDASSKSQVTPSLDLNYDHRSRNNLLESDHSACLNSFQELVERFTLLSLNSNGIRLNQPIKLQTSLTSTQSIKLNSSFGRELWFTCLHAIHHFTFIRVIAVGELHIDVPSDFGVAPSTLQFRSESKAKL